MKDFFGNELKINQEVAYMNNISNYGPNADLRKGIIIRIVKYENSSIEGIINIRSAQTNRTISRYPKQIIGNLEKYEIKKQY